MTRYLALLTGVVHFSDCKSKDEAGERFMEMVKRNEVGGLLVLTPEEYSHYRGYSTKKEKV